MITKVAARASRGFTLIEIVIVFLLIVILLGVGVGSLANESTKKQIVGPANELKKFARRGMQMSINNRRSYSIALKERSFVLREGYAKGPDEAEAADPRFAALFEEEKNSAGKVIDSFELDDNIRLEVRRWGEKLYREPEEDLWIFEPSGICEPLGVKLIHDEGSIEMDFNPLTAKISDQSLIMQERAD